MGKDSSVAWQGELGLLKAVIHGLFRIVHQRLTNELVVMKLFFRDTAQSFDNSVAWQSVQLLELDVMVVFSRAQIWLTRRQSFFHSDIQEAVL